MRGYCESCDRFTLRLWRKGAMWLCERCLEREL